MSDKNLKSLFYKKIILQSPKDYIRINCRNKFEFKYNVTVNIDSIINKYDIENDFINVVSMTYRGSSTKFMYLNNSDINSYFTLKSDFSNIFEFLDKFSTLAKSLSESHKLQQLNMHIKCGLNYIVRSKDWSKDFVYLYVDDNFKDFNDLERYDFEAIIDTYSEFGNKVIFDGEFLKTKNFVIKFMKKPDINKFEIEIDKKINDVQFMYSYNMIDKVLVTNYKSQNDKYNISINPKKLEHFSYLRILSDSSWCKNGYNVAYTENEILSRLYNI